MKKKLEAELISIAHRILKLKNRADVEQLQEEALKLYEKLSVLKFVEDNFADVKPTIGYASAEGKLEEIYNIEKEEIQPETKAKADEVKEEPKTDKKGEGKKDKAEAKDNKPAEEEPVADEIENVEQADDDKPAEEESKDEEGEAKAKEKDKKSNEPEIKIKIEKPEEELKADKKDEGKKDKAEVKDDKLAEEEPVAEKPDDAEQIEDDKPVEDKPKDEKAEAEKEDKKSNEPEHKIEIEKPEEELKAMEESAEAVYEKEQESSMEEEERAADAEMITIEPDKNTEVEDSNLDFEFAFERKPAPEEPKKEEKKEVGIEDFHDYKHPEFVKKSDAAEKPKDEPKDETKEEQKAESVKEEPKAEAKKEELKQEVPASPKSLNDTFAKTINLGLNDRIAFEKHLFGGSSDDLNRVISQLNTINSFEEAKNFIEDLVKPDYNDWQGKEEYEERLLQLVEKRFD